MSISLHRYLPNLVNFLFSSHTSKLQSDKNQAHTTGDRNSLSEQYSRPSTATHSTLNQEASEGVSECILQSALQWASLSELANLSDRELVQKGDVLYRQGRMDAAVLYYQWAIQANPASSEAYQHLAEALTQQNHLQEAADCYRRVIELESAKTAVYPTNQTAAAEAAEEEEEELPWFEQASFQLQQAMVHSQAGRWTKVITASQQAIEQLEPEVSSAYCFLGQALQQQGQFAEANQIYLKALAVQPDSVEVWARLGSLLAEQKQWKEAIECYQQAIRLKPDFAGAYWKLATVWEQIGDRRQTGLCRFAALRLEPTWATAAEKVQLGDRLRQLGELKLAIECYGWARKQEPELATAYYGLGEAWREQSQWAAAMQAYADAIKREPRISAYHTAMANAATRLEAWQTAANAYQQVIELAPDEWEGYAALREVLLKLGQQDKLLCCYDKLAKLQPDQPMRWHELGDELNRLCEWSEAVTAYQRAIELDSHFSWSHHNLGDALLHLEQWQQAATAYQKAIELHPEFHWSHYNLGEALMKLEQWNGAIEAYQIVLELQPDLPGIERKLGEAMRQRAKADRKAAIAHYQRAIEREPDNLQNYHQAIELQPDNVELYTGLGQALAKQGQIQNAAIFYRIAQQLRGEGIVQESQTKPLSQRNTDSASENGITLDSDLATLPDDFYYQQYLELHPDLQAAGLDQQQAINHFLEHGQSEGRVYSQEQLYFSKQYSQRTVGESSKYGRSPSKPTLNLGFSSPNPADLDNLPQDFDPVQYLELNPDLQALELAPQQAIEHYLQHGIEENRPYLIDQLYRLKQIGQNPPVVLDEEKALSSKRVAVFVHIYYFDLWAELKQYLQNLADFPFDLFINVVETVWIPEIHDRLRKDFPDARILISPNRGRDIGGYLALMSQIEWDQYDVFCLMHTKKSPHISPVLAERWRTDLLSAVLGSPQKVRTNLAILRNNSTIGALGSCYWRDTEISKNLATYSKLLDEFHIKSEAKDCEYIAGTMMLVKPQVIQPIYDRFHDLKYFENGDDKPLSFYLDGQLEHAIERLIGNLVRDQGMQFYWQI